MPDPPKARDLTRPLIDALKSTDPQTHVYCHLVHTLDLFTDCSAGLVKKVRPRYIYERIFRFLSSPPISMTRIACICQLIADQGYDSRKLRESLHARQMGGEANAATLADLDAKYGMERVDERSAS